MTHPFSLPFLPRPSIFSGPSIPPAHPSFSPHSFFSPHPQQVAGPSPFPAQEAPPAHLTLSLSSSPTGGPHLSGLPPTSRRRLLLTWPPAARPPASPVPSPLPHRVAVSAPQPHSRRLTTTPPETPAPSLFPTRDGNGAGSGRVEHTHARPDMGSG
jgi:hypothetical protein